MWQTGNKDVEAKMDDATTDDMDGMIALYSFLESSSLSGGLFAAATTFLNVVQGFLKEI